MISQTAKNVVVILCIGILPVMVTCKGTSQSPIIARVGKSVLTVDDFYQSIPIEYSDQITLEQNINYVKQWMDTELLFQEAMRRKICREPLIKTRLEKMKKDLLAAEMMNRFALQDGAISIDDNAVDTYYETNKDEFIRENDVAKYLEIVVADLRTALYVAKNATIDNFLAMAAEYSRQPYPQSDNIPYVALDGVLPEVRQAIASTSVNSVSNPVKSDMGYHVICVLDKQDKGGVCKLDEVREDIMGQLTARTQKEKIEQLLSDLRLKTNVQFNSGLLKNGNQPTGSVQQ